MRPLQAAGAAGDGAVSAGQPIPWAEAHAVATELVGLLADACERIEIAGSIRRRKGEVHDIEIVAIARVEQLPSEGLWGDVELTERNWLEGEVHRLVDDGTLAPRDVVVTRRDLTQETQQRMGRAYKALVYQGVPVDLFITDAERWGCIYALRTGPGDWNQRLVTDCKRHWRRVDDGRVLYHNKPVPTPEEADFFRALGVPWLDPEERRADRLRFDPELLKAVPA